MLQGLGDAIGAAWVIRTRHDDVGSEGLSPLGDAVIVGCNEYPSRPALHSALMHVFEHRPAQQIGERFSWKPARSVTGGNDDREFGCHYLPPSTPSNNSLKRFTADSLSSAATGTYQWSVVAKLRHLTASFSVI